LIHLMKSLQLYHPSNALDRNIIRSHWGRGGVGRPLQDGARRVTVRFSLCEGVDQSAALLLAADVAGDRGHGAELG
jgi:hypothetical protein